MTYANRYQRKIKQKRARNRQLFLHPVMVFACMILLAVIVSAGITALAVSNEWNGTAATSFAGGSGTEADPYRIETGEQLAYFSQMVNSGESYAGKYIRLTDDILLNAMNSDGAFASSSPREFTSIGNGSDKSFQGHFDGNGKTVIGLYINKSWQSYWGLFGYAAAGSVIRNLSIAGSVKGGHYIGGVAGYTNGVITGCAVSGAVTANEHYAGGVAGYAGPDSEISGCTVSATVQGRYYAGGVAGQTEGTITECTLSGTVTASENYAGGVAGYADGSEISGCTVSGTVRGRYYAGGVAGYTNGVITGCDLSGTVTANENFAGGMAGYAAGADSETSNCTVSGTVQGRYYVGGVAGRTEGVITGCSSDSTVTGLENFVGGVAGHAAGQSEVSDSSSAGAVSGRYYVGGVVGRTDETVTGCSSDSTVTGRENYVGGVAGYAGTGSEVSHSSTTGDVSGRYYIGGVAGYTDGAVTICANSGDVTGLEGNIGGVVGYADGNNTVSNCFNSGDVDGRNGVGGIAGGGNWTGDGSTINNNLSVGNVTGSYNVGGIVGSSTAPLGPDDAWNNYYTNASSGTGGGDVPDQDGAVPVGDMTWEEITDLLNSDNPAGGDTWTGGDDGVPIPEPFAPGHVIEILSAKIEEGKHYTAELPEAGPSAAVTSDSVFTVSFSVRYIAGCSLETQTVGLTGAGGAAVQIPAGAAVIMLADDSYYYINLQAPAERIALSQFAKMGTSPAAFYGPPPVQPDAEKSYLFIFDLTRTAEHIAAGTYKAALLPADGTAGGVMPAVTITGENSFSVAASGGTGMFAVNLSEVSAEGYDYKTDGKLYAYAFHLKKNGELLPWPIGTKVNEITVSSSLPYVFVAGALGDTVVAIDTSNSVDPLPEGNYTVEIKAYACSDGANPRNGYLLAGGESPVSMAAPVRYAIQAAAQTRVFDYSPADISVDFHIDTLGSAIVKSTLQRKVGTGYVNIAEQTDQPVSLAGGGAALIVPGGREKGTYRFVLTVYDDNGLARAQMVENIIIK